MSLFSKPNARCEVLTMRKNTILRWIYFLLTSARKPAIFLIARVARTPCTRPERGKLNRGLSQCEGTCGHGNSGSVSRYGRKGRGGGVGGLTTSEHFLEWEKSGNWNSFVTGKNTTVFDVANVIIGVDMKFEKKVQLGCRDTFPAITSFPWKLAQHSESSSRPYLQLLAHGC